MKLQNKLHIMLGAGLLGLSCMTPAQAIWGFGSSASKQVVAPTVKAVATKFSLSSWIPSSLTFSALGGAVTTQLYLDGVADSCLPTRLPAGDKVSSLEENVHLKFTEEDSKITQHITYSSRTKRFNLGNTPPVGGSEQQLPANKWLQLSDGRIVLGQANGVAKITTRDALTSKLTKLNANTHLVVPHNEQPQYITYSEEGGFKLKNSMQQPADGSVGYDFPADRWLELADGRIVMARDGQVTITTRNELALCALEPKDAFGLAVASYAAAGCTYLASVFAAHWKYKTAAAIVANTSCLGILTMYSLVGGTVWLACKYALAKGPQWKNGLTGWIGEQYRNLRARCTLEDDTSSMLLKGIGAVGLVAALVIDLYVRSKAA